MSESDIIKSQQPNSDDVLAAIQSFNDPSIITGIFKELGWSYSLEIRETLAMAKQNANLSIKFKAVKHLRELLREAAETSGCVANVSQTIPNAQGGQTTFSAKRIANILKPTKQIESTIKETQNERIQETKPEPDRGRDRPESERPESQDSKGDNPGRIQKGSSGGTDTLENISRGIDTLEQFPPGRDTGRADTSRDVVSGGTESTDGGETPEQQPGVVNSNDDTEKGENSCIKTRPPTCDPKLFPGISTSTEG